jgi:hypothetical protein
MTPRDVAHELRVALDTLRKQVYLINDARLKALYSDLFMDVIRVETSVKREHNTPLLKQPPRTEPEVNQTTSHTLDESVDTMKGDTQVHADGSITTLGKQQGNETSILGLFQDHMQAVVEQLAQRPGWQESHATSSDLFCTKVLITRPPNGKHTCYLFTHLALERKPGDPVVWPSGSVCFKFPEQAKPDNLGENFVITQDQLRDLRKVNRIVSELIEEVAETKQTGISQTNLHDSSPQLNSVQETISGIGGCIHGWVATNSSGSLIRCVHCGRHKLA